MNQFKVRRNFRSNLAESVTARLEKGLKKHDLNRTDFARLMTTKKLGSYGSWTSCYRRLCDLFNGRFPSDEFCANIINVLEKLDTDPRAAERSLKKRAGYSKFNVGQTLNSRDSHFSADSSNRGRLYLRRILRKAVKANS